jgi:hypothetical protein
MNYSTTFQDPLAGFYGDPMLVIITVSLVLLIEVLGNGLLIGIVLFEKYSGDPQKRTAKNQLISHIMYGFMVLNILALPLLAGRVLFGPIGMQIYILI